MRAGACEGLPPLGSLQQAVEKDALVLPPYLSLPWPWKRWRAGELEEQLVVLGVVPFVPEFDVAAQTWRCWQGIETNIEARERCPPECPRSPTRGDAVDREVRPD
jgi:hypothetical protein